MKTFFKILLKLLLVFGLFLSVFIGLIHYYNPFRQPQALATVFMEHGGPIMGIPKYLGLAGEKSSGQMELSINNLPVFMEFDHTQDSIKQVLDFYWPQMDSRPPLKRWVEKIVGKNWYKEAALKYLVEEIGFSMRVENEHKGVLVSFLPAFVEDDNLEQLTQRLERFSNTGNISEFFQPKMVMAEAQPNQGTRYTTFYPGGNFSIHNFVADQGQDTPGKDIPHVPRFPGSVRVVSVEHKSSPSGYHLVVYSIQEEVERVYQFYLGAMGNKGWKISESHDEALDKIDPQNLTDNQLTGEEKSIHFMRQQEQCHIVVGNDKNEVRIPVDDSIRNTEVTIIYWERTS